jgi:hypothetical protein
MMCEYDAEKHLLTLRLDRKNRSVQDRFEILISCLIAIHNIDSQHPINPFVCLIGLFSFRLRNIYATDKRS